MKKLLLTVVIAIPLIAMEEQPYYRGVVIIQDNSSNFEGLVFNVKNRPFSEFKNMIKEKQIISDKDCLSILYLKDKKLSTDTIKEHVSVKDLVDTYQNLFFISESILTLAKENPANKKRLYNDLWQLCCNFKNSDNSSSFVNHMINHIINS